jgi:hypothetical protein
LDETVQTAIRSGKTVWPELSCKGFVDRDQYAVKVLSALRPVIETGFEMVLLWAYVQAQLSKSHSILHVDDIIYFVLRNWNDEMRDELLRRFDTDKLSLMKSFASARDSVFAEDPMAWLVANPLYHEVYAALSGVDKERVAIVTTKQERFVRAILGHNNLDIATPGLSNRANDTTTPSAPTCNLFDLENRFGSKIDVLTELSRRHSRPGVHAGERIPPVIHFVEDRYETLLNVLKHRNRAQSGATDVIAGLQNVQLYLADWGYNIPEQRAAAWRNSDIQVINQQDFAALVQKVRR